MKKILFIVIGLLIFTNCSGPALRLSTYDVSLSADAQETTVWAKKTTIGEWTIQDESGWSHPNVPGTYQGEWFTATVPVGRDRIIIYVHENNTGNDRSCLIRPGHYGKDQTLTITQKAR